MFYVLLYVTLCPFYYCNHLDGEERELVALFNLSSWCLVMVERFFLAVPRGCLRFVIVVFPDHTHLLFLKKPIGHIINLSIEKNIVPKDFKKCSGCPSV